jgi:hypothetical protein
MVPRLAWRAVALMAHPGDHDQYRAWSAALGEAYDDATWQVWTNLKALAPQGWIPSSCKDPIIERAFVGVHFDNPAGDQ